MSSAAGPPPDGHDSPEAAAMLSQLWRTNHELELLSKRMIKALGVTGPQRMVLRITARKPGISATEICRAARIHPSTLTGILDRLVRGGFLERARDGEDGRRAQLRVTPAGLRIVQQRRGTVESAMGTSLATLSAVEQAGVRRWLDAFAEALEQERGELRCDDDERDAGGV